MQKIIQTTFANIDYSQYPIIKLVSNGVNPTENECTLFLERLMEVIDSHKGPYVTLVDGSKAIWISKEIRDLLAMGMQYIEEKNITRQKKNFIVVPNMILWFMVKFFNLVIKSKIPQDVYFDLEDALLDAHVFVQDFYSEKEKMAPFI